MVEARGREQSSPAGAKRARIAGLRLREGEGATLRGAGVAERAASREGLGRRVSREPEGGARRLLGCVLRAVFDGHRLSWDRFIMKAFYL